MAHTTHDPSGTISFPFVISVEQNRILVHKRLRRKSSIGQRFVGFIGTGKGTQGPRTWREESEFDMGLIQFSNKEQDYLGS